ncbi:MAG: hypothetical protein JRH20_20340 [Deltaproteobacteria bacterium]|nr:hypothetical protein [Deltaproteobacteria bacterium]
MLRRGASSSVVCFAMVGALVVACGDGAGQIPPPALNAGPASATLFQPTWQGGEAPAGSPFPDPTTTTATPLVPGGGGIEGDWFPCVGALDNNGDTCSRLDGSGYRFAAGLVTGLRADGEVMQPGESYCELAGTGTYTFDGVNLTIAGGDINLTAQVSIVGDRAQLIFSGESGTMRRISPSQSTGPCTYGQ